MLKRLLSEKKKIFGTWCEIPSAYTANIIAKAGMDFIIIDLEHGCIDYETAQNMVFAAQCENCETLIRVSALEETYILRALDTGASGIIIPHVECLADIEHIVNYSLFSPSGNRGFNPFIRACGYTGVNQDFLDKVNKNLTIGIIIESKESIDNLENIISSAPIDVIYIGQYDLSVSLGLPGDIQNSLVQKHIDRALTIIKNNDRFAGCMVHSIQDANESLKQGFNVILFKVDTNILYSSYSSFISSL